MALLSSSTIISISSSSTQIYKVYFIFGQSNSTGAALNADALPAELLDQHHVQMWQRAPSSSWEILNFTPGNNYSQGEGTYHGIELSLASLTTDSLLYIGKYGLGSTSIDRHLEGQDLYLNAKNLVVDPVLADLDAKGINYEVYLCWWQGEEDAEDTIEANAYPPKFTAWADTWENNIPGVKFRIFEIGAFGRPAEFVAIINGAFNTEAAARSNMEVISNQGVGGVHFTYTEMKVMVQEMLTYN